MELDRKREQDAARAKAYRERKRDAQQRDAKQRDAKPMRDAQQRDAKQTGNRHAELQANDPCGTCGDGRLTEWNAARGIDRCNECLSQDPAFQNERAKLRSKAPVPGACVDCHAPADSPTDPARCRPHALSRVMRTIPWADRKLRAM
jgi:hypothetical protein